MVASARRACSREDVAGELGPAAEAQGDRIRGALAEFARTRGDLPERLSELGLPADQLELPCGTHWRYTRRPRSGDPYALSLGEYERDQYVLFWSGRDGGWYWDT